MRLVRWVQLEEDLRVLRHEIRQSGETGVQLPVNFRRLIWNAQKIFKCKAHRPGPSGTTPYFQPSIEMASQSITAVIMERRAPALTSRRDAWL